MEIKFFTNSSEFKNALSEYEIIWSNEGNKIIDGLQKTSSLNFGTENVDAEIYEGISTSHPLRLRASYPNDVKKATLIHELCHILLDDNEMKFNSSEETHEKLNPILYKTWVDLYGKDFADKMIVVESKRTDMYKRVWEKLNK